MMDVMGPPPAIGKHERHSDKNNIGQLIERYAPTPDTVWSKIVISKKNSENLEILFWSNKKSTFNCQENSLHMYMIYIPLVFISQSLTVVSRDVVAMICLSLMDGKKMQDSTASPCSLYSCTIFLPLISHNYNPKKIILKSCLVKSLN